MKISVIIAAAGSGKRMGGGLNKQYILIGGMPVLARSIRVYDDMDEISEIIVVVKAGEEDRCRRDIVDRYGFRKVSAVVAGGAERPESVRKALSQVAPDADTVLVQDGARPFTSAGVIRGVIDGVRRTGAAVPGIPVKDTIKVIRCAGDVGPDAGIAVSTPDRATLRAVQTPQGFRRDILERAYRSDFDMYSVTDDAMLVEMLGLPVEVTVGDADNIKITTPDDIERAERIAASLFNDASAPPTSSGITDTSLYNDATDISKDSGNDMNINSLPRTGIGYDVHAFAPDRKLILGGVEIPHDRGLLGHSDADVMVHAVMDALLGAAALGDIGKHFPDSDPQYKGISSLRLLGHVGALLAGEGWQIVNLDAVIIAQRPKISPYIPQMQKNMADVLKISPLQISIKGTTTEKLGFAGREEGIASEAVATIVKY